MSRVTKIIISFVIVIFRPLISDIFNFFFSIFQKKIFKYFQKIQFLIEHKKNYENRSMGFQVTLYS